MLPKPVLLASATLSSWQGQRASVPDHATEAVLRYGCCQPCLVQAKMLLARARLDE